MIILRLDRMLAERKISSKELAERVGISQVNMSRIKTGKVSAIRFSTLDAICRALDCQPGDVLSCDAVRLENTLPIALKGAATAEPTKRTGEVIVVTPERTA